MTIFGLYLSDMRTENFEESDRLVAYSARREDLENLLINEKVPSYRDPEGDYVWIKTFRKHGPLEWCNDIRARPPVRFQFGIFEAVQVDLSGFGFKIDQIYTLEEYVQKHERSYRELLASAYDAGMLEGDVVVGHLALTAGNEEGDEHGQDDEEALEGQEEAHAPQRQGQGDHQVDDGEGRDDAHDREEDQAHAVDGLAVAAEAEVNELIEDERERLTWHSSHPARLREEARRKKRGT